MSSSALAARDFVRDAQFVWHQRFELVSGVYTPGPADIEWLINRCDVPPDLTGMTVLDIGTSNGGLCFAMERRGAARVVGVDIFPPTHFGFQQLKTFLGSRAQFVQASIYELPVVLQDSFDLVFFLGVLYHLRHPLLALDNLRLLMKRYAYIETAVSDGEVGSSSNLPLARFYRRGELAGDTNNWFGPTAACLSDWCWSSGLEPLAIDTWPSNTQERCLAKVRRTEGQPEFERISYERRLRYR